jgi:hypothetical protein
LIVVKVETTLDYEVNVTLPDFNFTFSLVITTLLNDYPVLSIVKDIELVEISSSVQPQNQNPKPMFRTGIDNNITSRAILDFGKVKVSILQNAIEVQKKDHFDY